MKEDENKKEFAFTCSECGLVHLGAPSFSHKFPAQYFDVPEDIRDKYTIAESDLCKIKNYPDGPLTEDAYFIRVVLEIPILDCDQPFTWGVWVSQSKEKFEEYVELFGEDANEFESFAWLLTNLPTYKTLTEEGYIESLPCQVVGRGEGLRPLVFISECAHQLYKDQTKGITWDRAVEIARKAMHP